MQFDLKIGGKFAENVEINVNMFSGEKMGKCILYLFSACPGLAAFICIGFIVPIFQADRFGGYLSTDN